MKENSVAVEKKLDFDPNSDTAFFGIVNQHSEKMKQERLAQEYAKLKHLEENRAFMIAQERKEKVNFVLDIIKAAIFILSVVFLVWVFASWVNVASNNTQANGYDLIWTWNFFKVFFGN